MKRAQAPLWQDGGSFLQIISSQRSQPGVNLAPLLLLGNLTAAGTVSTLSSCPGDLSPSPQAGMLLCHVTMMPCHGLCVGCRCWGYAQGEAGPAVAVLVGTAGLGDVLARPEATRQHPPRQPVQEAGTRPLCSDTVLRLISRDNYPRQSANLISLDKAHR